MRHNNQLPNNLPQLQNLIKRDPESYRDEFLQQYRHFNSILEVFQIDPSQQNKGLDELVMFLSQVAQCYIDDLLKFPQQIVDILKNNSTILEPTMRHTFCRALILLRNKNLIQVLDLLQLFFQLLRCPDKALRSFLKNHIVSDIKNLNTKQKDLKLNSTLQNFMYSMMKDSNPKAAKMSVDIMIDLYKKNIWTDEKTVNAIATVGCFSKTTKVMVASLKFFLGTNVTESDESDSDNEPDLKSAMMVNRINKKTKKRQKQLETIKKQVVKASKKQKNAPIFHFSGFHLIHNPQGIAENLFKQLETQNDRFEVKLMHLDVISRLIGIHELFLFSFYPYITRFLQPHQRQVTRILQFAAQSAHKLVPGDIIESVLKTIANNFITERNASDVMAIGLNAVREICCRCPLAMSECLLRDLVLYKTYKEKSVMMAARSLIMLYRSQIPTLLHKKDRGRPTEAQVEIIPKNYGEVNVIDTIPGAEALLKSSETVVLKENVYNDSDSESNDDWIDINPSEYDEESDDDNSEDNRSVDKSENDGNNTNYENEKHEFQKLDCKNIDPGNAAVGKNQNKSEHQLNIKLKSNNVNILDQKQAVKEIILTRILTDADFKRIDIENVKKHTTNAHKRSLENDTSEYVRLDDIEMIYKKRKNDKDTRKDSVLNGREDREKFGYRDNRMNIYCSKTNKEKRKKKNYVMMRQKARSKVKRSFKDRQQALRKHLLKQKKMK